MNSTVMNRDTTIWFQTQKCCKVIDKTNTICNKILFSTETTTHDIKLINFILFKKCIVKFPTNAIYQSRKNTSKY